MMNGVEITDIIKIAMENYEGIEDGLYFPNLGGQVVPLDNERIAQYLDDCNIIEDCNEVTEEEIVDLYNEYYEMVDYDALFTAIVLGEIDTDMITED